MLSDICCNDRIVKLTVDFLNDVLWSHLLTVPGTADAGVPRRFRSGRLGRLRGRCLRVRVRFKADDACRLGDLGRRRGGVAAVQRAVRGPRGRARQTAPAAGSSAG